MSASDELQRLVDLKKQGVLSAEEFDRLKSAAIAMHSPQRQAASRPTTFRRAGESELRGELRRQRWEIHHPREAQMMDLARWIRTLPPWGRAAMAVVLLAPIAMVILVVIAVRS